MTIIQKTVKETGGGTTASLSFVACRHGREMLDQSEGLHF
jgi:hypothetical protein